MSHVKTAVMRKYSVYYRSRRHLTPLYENIRAGSDEVCSVETRLKFCGDEFPLSSQLMSVLHCTNGIFLHTGDAYKVSVSKGHLRALQLYSLQSQNIYLHSSGQENRQSVYVCDV